MKKIFLKIVAIAIACILLVQLNIFASYNLTLETKTDATTYAVGGTVNVTVDWTEEMQAVGFILRYNSKKLSFEEAPISEDYYAISEVTASGTSEDTYKDISVQWADGTSKTNITFKFKAIASGNATISVVNANAFSNANIQQPEQIDYTTKGSKTIKITTLGDINLDGVVNLRDVILLNQYVSNVASLNEEALLNADVCTDDEINQLDVDILNKYVAGWAIKFPFVYGDANCDGTVNNLDKVCVTRHIDDEEYQDFELSNEGQNRADVNLDGQVDDKDRIILTRHLANWSDYNKLPIQFTKDTPLKFININNIKTVYGFDASKMKLSDFILRFNNNLAVTVYNKNGQKLSDNDYVGTGMTLKIGFKNKNEITDEDAEDLAGDIGEYTIMLYGDTTGDGKINAIDALALIKDINNKILLENEVYRQAGKVVSYANKVSVDPTETKATAVDALGIIKAANGKYEINSKII